jgi:hypothetical protein
VIVDQSEGTTSRTGGNRGDAGMGGNHDITEQSHLISSMAQGYEAHHTPSSEGKVKMKQPGCDAHLSPSSTTKVNNVWSYTSTSHTSL